MVEVVVVGLQQQMALPLKARFFLLKTAFIT
jgi:hypothetical protein